jgi:uncharacterized membrane protein YbhN (UPF0104 family)
MNYDILQPYLSGIAQYLEQFSTVMLIAIAVEVAIDFVARKKRNYKETAANVGIGIVQEIVSSAIAFGFIFAGLSFFWTLTRRP